MGSEHPQLLLENQLCFDLYSVSRRVTQTYRPTLERLGLTYPQYLVMLLLWEFEGISMKAMGYRLELDSGTLTPLLKRMEVQGLLKRQRSAIDEREVNIQISQKGSALKEQIQNLPFDMKCKMALSDKGLAQLQRQLRRLNNSLKSTDENR